MENIAKIAALEVHVDTIRKDIHRLETTISTIDRELDTYKADLQEAIAQCKGIVSQVAEMSSELKSINTEVTVAVVEVEACKKERKETIWKFIKENPEKSVKITLLVSIIIFLVSLKNFDVIAVFLRLIGVR